MFTLLLLLASLYASIKAAAAINGDYEAYLRAYIDSLLSNQAAEMAHNYEGLLRRATQHLENTFEVIATRDADILRSCYVAPDAAKFVRRVLQLDVDSNLPYATLGDSDWSAMVLRYLRGEYPRFDPATLVNYKLKYISNQIMHLFERLIGTDKLLLTANGLKADDITTLSSTFEARIFYLNILGLKECKLLKITEFIISVMDAIITVLQRYHVGFIRAAQAGLYNVNEGICSTLLQYDLFT